MANEKLNKFVDELLSKKRDGVFTKIDQVTNNIILQLEELKELGDFTQYQIPPDIEIAEKKPQVDTIGILHRYVMKISLAANQLDLITNFLEGINRFCSRAALFLLREDKLVGWKGKGFSGEGGEIGDEEIKKIFFSLSANTLFKYILIEEQKGYLGPPSPQPDDHLIYSRFGGKSPQKVFALPFFVKGKPQAVIYTDVFEGASIGKKEIEILAAVGEMSLDLLPLRQKILAKVKTQKYFEEEEEEEGEKVKPAENLEGFISTTSAEADEDQTLPSIKENDPERLARVIVNDIYLYNKEKVDQVLKSGENLYDFLQNTIMQSKELYLNKFNDLSPFEKQLIKTLARGNKEALKGYNFETI